MTKGIMLDAVAKTITEVEVGDFRDIQSKVGCDAFGIIDLGAGADYYYDDEGLLKNAYVDDDGVKHNMHGIQIKGYPQVIMGNALILGHDDMGESVDCPVPVAAVEGVVTFVEYDNPEDRPQPSMQFFAF
jgi:hypothetical protein